MPDHDELDTRLAALDALPAGALPGAAAARARGAQRTRRSRAALAAVGSVVAVLALTAGVALGSGPDRIAPPATGPSSSAPPSLATWDATDALLTAEDTTSVEPGDWVVSGAPQERLLDPCEGGTRYLTDETVEATERRGLEVRREAGGTQVDQEVYRYVSAQDAAEAVAGYRRAVEECPSEPETGILGGTRTHEGVATARDGELYVRVLTDCPSCAPYPYYLAVVQVGDGVAVLSVVVGADGDPGVELAEQYAEVAAAALRRAQD